MVVASLAQEDLIKRSPRGRKVATILNLLESMNPDDFAMVALIFNDQASQCIKATKKHKLPSAAMATLWSTFHQLWGSHSHISGLQDVKSSLFSASC